MSQTKSVFPFIDPATFRGGNSVDGRRFVCVRDEFEGREPGEKRSLRGRAVLCAKLRSLDLRQGEWGRFTRSRSGTGENGGQIWGFGCKLTKCAVNRLRLGWIASKSLTDDLGRSFTLTPYLASVLESEREL